MRLLEQFPRTPCSRKAVIEGSSLVRNLTSSTMKANKQTERYPLCIGRDVCMGVGARCSCSKTWVQGCMCGGRGGGGGEDGTGGSTYVTRARAC